MLSGYYVCKVQNPHVHVGNRGTHALLGSFGAGTTTPCGLSSALAAPHPLGIPWPLCTPAIGLVPS